MQRRSVCVDERTTIRHQCDSAAARGGFLVNHHPDGTLIHDDDAHRCDGKRAVDRRTASNRAPAFFFPLQRAPGAARIGWTTETRPAGRPARADLPGTAPAGFSSPAFLGEVQSVSEHVIVDHPHCWESFVQVHTVSAALSQTEIQQVYYRDMYGSDNLTSGYCTLR
jgi:hypothetical protein